MNDTLGRLIDAWRAVNVHLDVDGVCDALWFAREYAPEAPEFEATPTGARETPEAPPADAREAETDPPPETDPQGAEERPTAVVSREHAWLLREGDGLSVRVPGATALPQARGIARALRALRRTVASSREVEFDERATADTIAHTGLWLPVLRPAQKRWLDVALVVDRSRTMALWQATARELLGLLQRLGAFGDVRAWTIDADAPRRGVALREGLGGDGEPRATREIVDPGASRVVLVLSDCAGARWRDGVLRDAVMGWAEGGPVAIVQVLPEALWWSTGLPEGGPVAIVQVLPEALWWSTGLRAYGRDYLRGTTAGGRNPSLRAEIREELQAFAREGGRTVTARSALPVPVVTLEPGALQQWASVVLGAPEARVPGVLLRALKASKRDAPTKTASRGGDDHVARFDAWASSEARRLARKLAVVPLSLPIARWVMRAVAPQATLAHLAEVLYGGLTEEAHGLARAGGDPARVVYEFHRGVREVMLEDVPRDEMAWIYERVSEHLGARFGVFGDFEARVTKLSSARGDPLREAFARVSVHVLRMLGGEYGDLADRIEQGDLGGLQLPAGMREGDEPGVFVWDGPKGVGMEMVYVSPGVFWRGTDQGEEFWLRDARPKHLCEISKGYFVGRYPVTVGEFRAFVEAANYQTKAEVAKDTRTWRRPGFEQDDDHPVVLVSWNDAQRYCDWSGTRMLTEAEWEYAARGRDGREFPWGNEAPNDELLWWSGTTPRSGTGAVGKHPKGASPFGVMDMGGNVGEWTFDLYSEYESTLGGSIVRDPIEVNGTFRLLRGGSWDVSLVGRVRATARLYHPPDGRGGSLGFRVAVGAV